MYALTIRSVGVAVSSFFVVSYLICIGWGLLMPPRLHMHAAWAPMFPGFEWLSAEGFTVGLVEAWLYGWYVAVLLVPLLRWSTRHA